MCLFSPPRHSDSATCLGWKRLFTKLDKWILILIDIALPVLLQVSFFAILWAGPNYSCLRLIRRLKNYSLVKLFSPSLEIKQDLLHLYSKEIRITLLYTSSLIFDSYVCNKCFYILRYGQWLVNLRHYDPSGVALSTFLPIERSLPP